jgi:translation elongation factor TU
MATTDLARIVVLGARGHGKNTLAAALVATRASIGLATPSRLTTYVEYRSAKRRYWQFAPPPECDLPASLFSMPCMDAAVLMVSLETGVEPQTREHLLVARGAGVRQVVLFLNHRDAVDDAELVHLAMDEAGHAVEDAGLSLAATVVGGPLRALDHPHHGSARRCIDELVAELDRLPLAPRDETAPFLMSLQQSFVVGGRGHYVVGVVERGSVALDEDVELVGEHEREQVQFVLMEVDRQSAAVARAGDELGVLLRGCDQTPEFYLVAAQPGTIEVHERFAADLQVLRDAVVNNQQLSCCVRASVCGARVLTPRAVTAGTAARVEIVLNRALPLAHQSPFVLRDELGTVAIGHVVLPNGMPSARTVERKVAPKQVLQRVQQAAPGVGSATVSTFVEALLRKEPLARLALDDVDAAIVQIDAQVEGQLEPIMAHPSLRALERIWRALYDFVEPAVARRADGSGEVDILNVSRQELWEDFDDSPSVPRSGLSKLVYSAEFGSFGGRPYAAMMLDELLTAGDDDLWLLQQAAAVAHRACAVLIARVADRDLEQRFRDSHGSRFVVLTDVSPYRVAADIRESFHRYGWGAHAGWRTVDDQLGDIMIIARFVQSMLALQRGWCGVWKTPADIERNLLAWLGDYDALVGSSLVVRELPEDPSRFVFELALRPRWSQQPLVFEGHIDRE